MLGVTPEMAFFFYSFFKLSIFCRSDEKFDGVCQQLHNEHKWRGAQVEEKMIQHPGRKHEPLPVKRTVKKYKVFPAGSQCAASRFLCSETQRVLLHWSQHAQIALHPSGVVIADVALNHLNKLLLAGKAPAIIAFPFQDTP